MGARIYLGNSITAQGLGGAPRRGMSQTGVYHNLLRLVEIGGGVTGGTHTAAAAAADTLLAHCGGKRYKRAPREKEWPGERPSGRTVRFHCCASPSVFTRVCVCVWRCTWHLRWALSTPQRNKVWQVVFLFFFSSLQKIKGRSDWLKGGSLEELLKPVCSRTPKNGAQFSGGVFL